MNIGAKTGKSEWQTPRWLLDEVRRAFGIDRFGLDPCTDANNPADAEEFFTPAHDGLAQDWSATSIWCNPPWSKGAKIDPWVVKFWAATCDTGLFLAPASTSAKWFHRMLSVSDRILILNHRVNFVDPSVGQEVKGCMFDTVIFARSYKQARYSQHWKVVTL